MKAYLCIGGPLDGEYATSEDFRSTIIARIDRPAYAPAVRKGDVLREGGMYGHLESEYHAYNCAYRGIDVPMVYLHQSLLKPPIAPAKR